MADQATLQVYVKLRDEFSQKFRQFQQTTEQGGKKVEQTASRMSAGWTRVGTAIKGAVAAYLGWRGIQQAYSAVRDYAKLEAVRIGFANLSKDIGISANAIDRWREAVQATIGDVDLLEQANRLLVAGVIKTEEEFTAVSRAGFILARVTGKDVKSSIDQLVAALAGASPRSLRQLGIDMETIWRQQREITGEELPLELKQRTMINALIDKMRHGFGDIEKVQTTTLEKVQQAETHWGNVSENVGEIFAGLGGVNERLSLTVERLTAAAAKLAKMNADAESLSKQEGPIYGWQGWRALGKIPALGPAFIFGRMGIGAEEAARARERQAAPGIGAMAGIGAGGSRLQDPYWYEGMKGKQELARQGAEKLWKYIEKGAAAYSEYADQLYEQQRLINEELSLQTARGALLDELTAKVAKQKEAWDQVQQVIEDYTLSTQTAAAAVADGIYWTLESTRTLIGDVFFDALQQKMKSFKEYLRTFLLDIGRALSDFAAKMAVAGLIQLGTSILGGAATGAIIPSQSQFGQLYNMYVPGLQHGGRTEPGVPYWVGERGPELRVFDRPGYVAPTPALAGAGTVQNITIAPQFSFQMVDASGMAAALYKAKGPLIEIIKKAVHWSPNDRSFFGRL